MYVCILSRKFHVVAVVVYANGQWRTTSTGLTIFSDIDEA